jgi:DNA-binding transcriptional MocR family regulator
MENRATSAQVARSSSTARLVELLGDWMGASGPLYRRLARALAAAVEHGELAASDRLPSERALAAAVAVSRGVAVAAYDELVADGVVERRQGSGTYVTGPPGGALPAGREGSSLVRRFVERRAAPGVIDLSISVLTDPAGLPDIAVGLADLGPGADDPWGLPALRSRVAERLGAIGLATRPEQVVITTGAQQGLSIAAGCWVRPGDRVVIDDPTYPGALSAVLAAGARPVPVAVDRHGPVLADLEAALAERPALVYVQSGVHSPTGGRLSDHRRDQIARLVAAHRVPLVEDHALFALDWSGARAPSPIAARIPEHPVAVVGSYSKRFWGGLRVGFVRAPEPVARRLVRVKATHDLGSSAVSQLAALRLLDHRDHASFVDARNRQLADRARLLHDLVAEHLPTWRATVPDGGLSLWVQLPAPVAARFAEVALRHGASVAPADGLTSQPERHRDRLRVSFARPEHDLRAAVDRLVGAWAELGAGVRSGRRGELPATSALDLAAVRSRR